jgi:hypothetical protein
MKVFVRGDPIVQNKNFPGLLSVSALVRFKQRRATQMKEQHDNNGAE